MFIASLLPMFRRGYHFVGLVVLLSMFSFLLLPSDAQASSYRSSGELSGMDLSNKFLPALSVLG